MKYIIFFLGLISINSLCGQNLYQEKFENCKLSMFCLDCGDIKAIPPESFIDDFVSNLNKKSLSKIGGNIEVQILVDSLGKPCLLSANNETNVKSKKLNLQYAINQTANWAPALKEGEIKEVSVSLLLNFSNGKLSIRRRDFNASSNSNFRSVGTPKVKGTNQDKLSQSWTLFDQKNSKLPWDMSRAVAVDNNGVIWLGTDSGLVKVKNEQMEVFDTKNSSLKSELYDEDETVSIRDISIDNENNIWLIASWDVYRFNGENWMLYDSLNSPINWARKIFVDNANNIWFTSWKGISKYDGEVWTSINTSNSKLPSNKTLGIYVDSKERVWIGTFEGNIRIDKDETVEFDNEDSPLCEGFISQMFEDKKGNLWFDLYSKDKSKAGIYKLRTDGEWESIKPKKSDLFTENDINHFLLDEDQNILWIALNSVGLIRYDISADNWETYTNENSNVPSIHVMQLAKEKDGTIWAATFAGIIKLN